MLRYSSRQVTNCVVKSWLYTCESFRIYHGIFSEDILQYAFVQSESRIVRDNFVEEGIVNLSQWLEMLVCSPYFISAKLGVVAFFFFGCCQICHDVQYLGSCIRNKPYDLFQVRIDLQSSQVDVLIGIHMIQPFVSSNSGMTLYPYCSLTAFCKRVKIRSNTDFGPLFSVNSGAQSINDFWQFFLIKRKKQGIGRFGYVVITICWSNSIEAPLSNRDMWDNITMHDLMCLSFLLSVPSFRKSRINLIVASDMFLSDAQLYMVLPMLTIFIASRRK